MSVKCAPFGVVLCSACNFVLLLERLRETVNPLECKANYTAIPNNMKLVQWPLMGGLLHLVQRGVDWAGPQPAQAPPRCTKYNSPPINASVPITVLLYNGPLHCGLNVPTKGLKLSSSDFLNR